MGRALLIFQTPEQSRRYATTMPPLGMLSVASFLESRGIPVDVRDCHVQKLDVDFTDYDVVFFGINISNLENSLRTIGQVKAESPGTRVVVGGSSVIERCRRYLHYPEIDAAILGEAELTAYEFMRNPKSTEVKGLFLRGQHGRILFTGERSLLMDLDTLPFPALDKVPLERYHLAIRKATVVSSMMTSRGCPHGCIFCYHSPTWRQRSPQNVVSEFEWQIGTLGAQEIAIYDDNFGLSRQRAWDISQGIIDRGIRVPWQLRNGVRADSLDKPLLEKMRDAGLWLVPLSPETGSIESLRRIKKGFTLEQVKRVVTWCKELGLATYGCFSVGYPWETEEHLQQTLEFSRDLDTDFVQFTRAIPVEGTPLFGMVGAEPGDEMKESGWFYYRHTTGRKMKLSPETIHSFVKTAHRSHYARLKSITRVAGILSPREILHLARYSRVSESM